MGNSPLSERTYVCSFQNFDLDFFPHWVNRKADETAFAQWGIPCRLCQGLPGRETSGVLSLDTAPAPGCRAVCFMSACSIR